MKINDLKPAPGAKKSRRRVGRGLGSGRGKTAGRGQKGQASRSGFSQGSGWEGGRSRLIMRLPKRGFTHQGIEYQIINLRDLNDFDEGSTVNAESLRNAGVIRHANRPVKLLGDGELTVRNLRLELDACSRGAAQAVQDAGGSVVGLEQSAQEEAGSSQPSNQAVSTQKANQEVAQSDKENQALSAAQSNESQSGYDEGDDDDGKTVIDSPEETQSGPEDDNMSQGVSEAPSSPEENGSSEGAAEDEEQS